MAPPNKIQTQGPQGISPESVVKQESSVINTDGQNSFPLPPPLYPAPLLPSPPNPSGPSRSPTPTTPPSKRQRSSSSSLDSAGPSLLTIKGNTQLMQTVDIIQLMFQTDRRLQTFRKRQRRAEAKVMRHLQQLQEQEEMTEQQQEILQILQIILQQQQNMKREKIIEPQQQMILQLLQIIRQLQQQCHNSY
ncbi:uncharacterized protein V6R79_023769 [Siganus canaliculatus]